MWAEAKSTASTLEADSKGRHDETKVRRRVDGPGRGLEGDRALTGLGQSYGVHPMLHRCKCALGSDCALVFAGTRRSTLALMR